MSLHPTSPEILRLKSIADDLERQLLKAREKLHTAICAEYPYQPGSVVLINKKRNDGFVGRVECLYVKGDRIEMTVVKQLKSGQFSSFPTKVRSYMSVEPI